MITYQLEPLALWKRDGEPLFKDHWLEVAIDQDCIPMGMHWPAYQQLEDAGQLHIMTVRDTGALIGYHTSMVRPHLHYYTSMSAFVDLYYLRPVYRRGWIGYRLFTEAEQSLKAWGVQKIFTGNKLHLETTMDLQRLFARLGYRESDRLWTKVLGE